MLVCRILLQGVYFSTPPQQASVDTCVTQYHRLNCINVLKTSTEMERICKVVMAYLRHLKFFFPETEQNVGCNVTQISSIPFLSSPPWPDPTLLILTEK